MRVLPALLAVVGPMLVLGGAGVGLWNLRDAEERTAEENAGRVVNANVTEVGAVAAIDRLLRLRQPRVLVLGPSYANTDTLPELLANRLGVARDDIALLSVPNSVGAHWYAMLNYRVYEGGYRPELVVVVSGLQSVLLNTPLTEASRLNLDIHLPRDRRDPEIEARVASSGALWWGRLKDQRTKARDLVFAALRDRPVRWLGRVVRADRGATDVDGVRRALDAVFADERVDATLRGQGSPIAAVESDERGYDLSVLAPPEASFVPVITDLVRNRGGQIVWVRPPMSPSIPANLDDVVPDGFQERAQALVEARGGHFVDMRSLPMTEAMFRNVDHMNREGSRRFTEALAGVLNEVDALGRRAETLAEGYPPTSVLLRSRGRPPVPLTTDAWIGGRTLDPGDRLELRFEALWSSLRGPFEGDLRVEGDGELHITLNGEAIPLRREGSSWVGGWRQPAPERGWSLVLDAPETGSPWKVDHLVLGAGAGRVDVIGHSVPAGPVVDLVARPALVDGRWTDDSVPPTFAGPPGKVPGADRPTQEVHGPVARFGTERWGFLSDEQLMGASHFGSRCSPLRVVEDGVPLAHPNVPCGDVARLGGGRFCHAPEAILFASSDGTDPDRNGRAYRLALDPARRCDGATWIYPVDRFTVAFPADRLARLKGPAVRFEFEARYLQHRQATLVVRLRVDGEVRVEERVDSRAFAAGPLRYRLDPPVPSTASVVVEVENEDYVFYLVDGMRLVGAPPSAGQVEQDVDVGHDP